MNDPFFSVRQGSINSNAAHARYMVSCEKCSNTYCLICRMIGCPKCGEKHFVDSNVQAKKQGWKE